MGVRVLVLASASELQRAIVRGVRKGRGTVVAVVERSDEPLSWPRVWSRRSRKLLRDGWPLDAARRLTYTSDVHGRRFARLLRKRKVDLVIVSRWPKVDPEVFSGLTFGAVNTHLSLLPELRGRHPLAGALLARLRETGVTITFIDERIDAGDIVLQRRLPIEPADTERSLTGKAAELVEAMYAELIPAFRSGTIERRSQSAALSYFSWRMHFGCTAREALGIDWTAPAWLIHRLVELRRCHVCWRDERIDIASSGLAAQTAPDGAEPGLVVRRDGAAIVVVAGEGSVRLLLDRAAGPREGMHEGPIAVPEPGDVLNSRVWPRWRQFATWALTRPHYSHGDASAGVDE